MNYFDVEKADKLMQEIGDVLWVDVISAVELQVEEDLRRFGYK